MSEHAWVQENLESHVAGGLEATECERLEQHVAACADCAQRLGELRQFDHELDWLFTVVRPRADLEDRMVQSLRTAPTPRRLRVPLFLKIATAAAAVVMLGGLGAVLSGMMVTEDNNSRASRELGSGSPDSFLRQWIYDVSESMAEASPGYQSLGSVRMGAPIKDQRGADWDADVDSRVRKEIAGRSSQERAERLVGRLEETHDEMRRMQSDRPNGTDRINYAPVFVSPTSEWAVPRSVDQIAGEMRGKLSGHGLARSMLGGTSTPDAYAFFTTPDADAKGNKGKFDTAGGVLHSYGGSVIVDNKKDKESSLKHDEIGLDPKVSTNYKADRTKEVSVPGPVSPNEKSGIANGANNPSAPVQDSNIAKNRPTTSSPAAGQTPSFGPPILSKMPYVNRPFQNRGYAESTTPSAPTPPKPGDGEKPAADGDKKSTFNGETEAKGKAKVDPAVSKTPEPVTLPKARDGIIAFVQQKKPDDQAPDKPAKPEPAPAQQRKIIRSGDMEFEVEGFDAAVDKVTKIAGEEQGFIATVNSEKLPNGKVQGSIVVRVAPERLDTLILKLRALGELKSQKIGSQDITKAYTDLESRLRAARTMEERLLAIIKSGKGEIKDLLLAEKELGEWRTRIETIEGEVRYYNNLVSLSTLTVTLTEKEIRAAFGLTETERVQLGIEVEDVEKAQREALAAVAEAKGRVTKSELKQFEANRLQALMQFEAAPESAGPLRDRLKQLGSVARLDIDRSTKSEGGSGRPQDAKVKRSDVQFELSLYNLAATSPRKTVHVDVACADTEAAYKAILERVKTPGRVVTSNLDRQRGDQGSGTITLEVRDSDADAMLAAIKDAGEVMRLQETENPDVQGVTRSKRGFVVKLVALGGVNPRETADIKLLARSVPDGFKLLKDAVAKAKGQVLNARLDEQDRRNITARVELTIRRDEEAGLNAALASAGDIYSRTVSRAQDAENVSDSKVRLNIDLLSVVPPRETITLLIETSDVDRAVEVLTGLAAESKGRTEEANVSHEVDGRVSAALVFTVPLSATPAFVEKIRGAGTIRGQKNSRNPQVADNDLASARIDVILSNAPLIVPRDDGLWPQIRRGLQTSFIALSWSLFVVIVGLSFVLPWAAILYGGYRLWVRMRAPSAGTT